VKERTAATRRRSCPAAAWSTNLYVTLDQLSPAGRLARACRGLRDIDRAAAALSRNTRGLAALPAESEDQA